MTGALPKITASPVFSVAACCLALVAINAWQLVLPNFSFDNSFSLAAARSLSEGHGYSLATAAVDDLSRVHYQALNKWPPGYAALLWLVRGISGVSWTLACYLVNAAGATLLVLAIRQTLCRLELSRTVINLSTLYAGMLPYPFLGVWFSDLLGVACYLWGVVLLLKVLSSGSSKTGYAVLAGLLFSGCLLLKYLYLPLALLPGALLLLKSWRGKDFSLQGAALLSLAVTAASMGGLLWFQYRGSGTAVYINPTGRGFFPRHLLHMGPFVPASFLNLALYYEQTSRWLHLSWTQTLLVWRILGYMLAGCMGLAAWRYFRKTGMDLGRPAGYFSWLGILVTLVLLSMLAALSLSWGHYVNAGLPYWTYLEELRYYGVALLFIQISVIAALFGSPAAALPLSWRRFFRVCLLAVGLVECLHGLYYLPRQVLIKKQVATARTSEQPDLYALRICTRLARQGPALVLCSDNHELVNIASLGGAAVLYDWHELSKDLRSSRPVRLLVMLHPSDWDRYGPGLAKYHPRLLGQQYNFYFYLTDIPGQ